MLEPTTNITHNTESVPIEHQPITFFKNAPAYNTSNNIMKGGEPAANEITHVPTPTPQPNIVSDIDGIINAQNLEQTESEQLEDTVKQYIKLLDPADIYFIKYQYIYDNGEKYISYLKSAEFIQYKKDRRALEAKYSNNKRYTIEVTKKHVFVYKKNSEGVTEKNASAKLDELKRPTYIDLTRIFEHAHKNVTQQRLKIKALYGQYMQRPFIATETKAKFIKQRETLITKLNDFYSIQYYYNKVNGLMQTERVVSLPKLNYYYSENANDLVPRLIAKDVTIPADDLKLLYASGATKLELYNKIQEMLHDGGDTKELRELIKQYINFDAEQQQRDLLYMIEKRKNHQLVTYLVVPNGLEMPVDNCILCPKDMRQIFAIRNAMANNRASDTS